MPAPSLMQLVLFSPLIALFALPAPTAAASPWPPSARQMAEAVVAKLSVHELANLTAARRLQPYQGTMPLQDIPALAAFGLSHFGHSDGPQVAQRMHPITLAVQSHSMSCRAWRTASLT